MTAPTFGFAFLLIAAIWFGFQIGAMWGVWTGRKEER